ncbi:Filament-like plant protein 4-like protein [Drosera capensis]
MEGRSWWKRKSSSKSATEKAIATLDSATAPLASGGTQSEKDNYKKPNYVQISVESYGHLTGLEDQMKNYEEQVEAYEDQIKTLEEQVDELNEKLASAHSEMTNKDKLVKQHAKVAEEAVSGWEKAEAEALTLKNHLETVTLSKLTAEDRATHLDGALKECMRQIRNLKEENEQNLQELALAKNKQLENLKVNFEAKIASLDQELLRAAADNAALSRSLQERSNMLFKINEEKSQAEAEINTLKNNIESCEREINSLKYELHIVSKELEIRNEEKNMSAKSAEVANKQHMEGVKKIMKLEAECQRLRGLVRKKLPGPAALAQMKIEVESLGREYGDTSHRKSPGKPVSPQFPHNIHMLQAPEFSLDGHQKFQKENEFLAERLFSMEEETKMLKEALAHRNSELQASRNMCAKTATKLQSLEAQLQTLDLQKSSAKIDDQTSTRRSSNPPSIASLSEDGNFDTGSCADSWSSTMISEISHLKMKRVDTSKTDSVKRLELMDDFLEMEKLAGISNGSGGVISGIEEQICNGTESVKLEEVAGALSTLQTKIRKVFESIPNESDVEKMLEEIKSVVREMHAMLLPPPVNCVSEEKHCSGDTAAQRALLENARTPASGEISMVEDGTRGKPTEAIESQALVSAVSHIHDFVLSLGKEASAVGTSDEENCLSLKIEEFSTSFNKVLRNDMSLADFIVVLSEVLFKASDLSISFLGYKCNEAEGSSPDCIDKVALPENSTPLQERYSHGSHISYSSSNPEVPHEANIITGFDSATFKCTGFDSATFKCTGFDSATFKCTLEDLEVLKAEKDNIVRDFARCSEDLESTKIQLRETEQLLAEVKSQFASALKTNSLAETQLKCMAESYKSLERRAEELETDVNLLRNEVESLENELQSEKICHKDALAKCKALEEQLLRDQSCAVCSAAADMDIKDKQENELAAAAEKLAECQESIFLLGRQLKALHPSTDVLGSPLSERGEKGNMHLEEEPTTSGMSLEEYYQADTETPTETPSFTGFLKPGGAESPLNMYTAPFSPSDADGNGFLRSPVSIKNPPKHRTTKSGSSSASSTPTPEKQSRGFSRFFSSKGKNGQ